MSPQAAPIRFDGQVALVTGAGHGLGRAYAENLAARGATLLVNNRRRPGDGGGSAEELAAEIRSRGGRALANGERVDSPGAGTRMVEQALEAFGRLDILICNAGLSSVRAFHRLTPEELRELVEVNLWGSLAPLHAALSPMREAGYGRILLTSSTAALFGDAGFSAYAAAKAAWIGLVPSLAAESAARGVAVNAIVPFALTRMTRRLFDQGHLPAESAEKMDPRRVADLATWLVSRDCPVNGQLLIAGGGALGRARMQASRGVALPAGASGPEAVAAEYARLADMRGAREFESGGEFLNALIRRVLDA